MKEKKDYRVKILVCCHKPDIVPNQEPYVPIHVGAQNSQYNLDMIGDNTGDNISEKNPSYCELTGLYWAWKNLKDYDIIGLCHYRRYFDFHGRTRLFLPGDVVKPEDFGSIDLSIPHKILKQVASGAVVISKPLSFPYNVAAYYCTQQISEDYRILKQIIKDIKPLRDFNAFVNCMEYENSYSPYNMMIMNRKIFDQYCNWLFSILSEAEKRIDISHYNPVQKRIYGYFGEQLLNVWLKSNSVTTLKFPVLKIDNERSVVSPINSLIRKFRYQLANYILGSSKCCL